MISLFPCIRYLHSYPPSHPIQFRSRLSNSCILHKSDKEYRNAVTCWMKIVSEGEIEEGPRRERSEKMGWNVNFYGIYVL